MKEAAMISKTNGIRLLASVLLASAGVGGADASVTITSAHPTANMICSAGVCTPTRKSAILNITDLQNMLAASSVKVTTGSGALASETSDIDVNMAVTWGGTSTLTLDAYHSIALNRAVSITGNGGLALVTNDGGSGGALTFLKYGAVTFWSLSSSLSINGATYTLVGNIATLASDIAGHPTGDFALAADYNAASDGTYTSSPIPTVFNGTFEGLGHTISHLSINALENGNVGLFKEVGDVGGTVADLHLSNAHYFIRGAL
jgi:hypothetical protein